MMTSTEQKNVRGGVSGDTLRSTVEAVFSGWREWSKELGNLSNLKTTDKSNVVAAINEVDAQNNIKTYTMLEQMGLSDDNMSSDDFAANLSIIDRNSKVSGQHFTLLIRLPEYPNFTKSFMEKFNEDLSTNVNFGDGAAHILKITRTAHGSHCLIDMEVFPETNYQYLRTRKIFGRADLDGQTMNVYPFRELAKIEKPATEIELLNGWEKYKDEFVISKIGDYVNLTFAIDKGTRSNGTVVFVLPEKFRPKGIRSCPILASSQQVGNHTRVAFYPNGNAVLYGCDTSENYLVFAGGFTI